MRNLTLIRSLVKTDSFKRFIEQCEQLENINKEDEEKSSEFVIGLVAPNVDARLFEIVSYSILKNYYKDEKIYWGFSRDDLKEENLKLYKTGRTKPWRCFRCSRRNCSSK